MARRKSEPQESATPLDEFVHSQNTEELCAAAASSSLTEELALALLTRRDLPHKALEQVSRNSAVIKHRKVMVALVCHPRTPRHVSMPLTRHLHTFELMQVALTPSLAADLKVAVEEGLMVRLQAIAAGERLALARRASTRVAAALLADADERVVAAALANPYMTEEWVVKALGKKDSSAALVQAVCRHPKWSARRDIQIALLRNESTPLGAALACARKVPATMLRDILEHSRLPAATRIYLIEQMERRR